jgi:hypothetical protein
MIVASRSLGLPPADWGVERDGRGTASAAEARAD